MYFFQSTGFKESNNMAVKDIQSNDQLLWKVMSSCYHME